LSSPPAIEVRDVWFSYGEAPVLEGADFQIGPREMVCIVGPNGGGKTTLVKLILGLLRPDAGRVRVFGQPPQRARLRIGYMPQYIRHDLQFPMTVMELVLMGRLGAPGLRGFLGWHNDADRRAARRALEQVEMASRANHAYASLSGGQRQRVLIARALACEPDLLLLDEPTANVDMMGEGRLRDILREMNERMAIVTVTHDLGFVSNLVKRVVCVNRRVAVHPTEHVSGEVIHELYDDHVRWVDHKEHQH